MNEQTWRDLYCAQCSLQFYEKSVFDMHLSFVHLQNTHTVESRPSLKEQKRHLPYGNDDKKSFKCDTCDASFTLQKHLKGHIALVHEGKLPYKCSHCEQSFSNTAVLKSHIVSVHEKKKSLPPLPQKSSAHGMGGHTIFGNAHFSGRINENTTSVQPGTNVYAQANNIPGGIINITLCILLTYLKSWTFIFMCLLNK